MSLPVTTHTHTHTHVMSGTVDGKNIRASHTHYNSTNINKDDLIIFYQVCLMHVILLESYVQE